MSDIVFSDTKLSLFFVMVGYLAIIGVLAAVYFRWRRSRRPQNK